MGRPKSKQHSEEVLMQRNRSRRRAQRSGWFRVVCMVLVLLTSTIVSSALAQGNEHWVGTWGNALHEPDLGAPGLSNPGFNNQTLRQIVHISVGGPRLRVRLSTFGAGSVVIGAAHIALRGMVPASI